MKDTTKCLILHTELSGYFLACLKYLSDLPGIETHVVQWPVNAIAPFNFDLSNLNINFYERSNYSEKQLLKLAETIDPDIILCGGWIDRVYIKICRKPSWAF